MRITRRGLPLLAALTLSLFVGCGGSTGSSSTARLRVVHASPNAPNVNVLVDNFTVLNNVAYKTASNYITVSSGTRNVKVRPTGGATNVIDANVPLVADTPNTVLAVGRLANIEALVLSDTTPAPAAGNVKLRAVHASPSAGNVDIYVTAPAADLATTNPTLSNVAYKASSQFLEVPAGTYRIRVTPTGSKTVALDGGNLNLSAGQIRTAVVVGDPAADYPVELLTLADN